MAEWTNIFDLGEWDIYLRYKGVTEGPLPDSRENWVKAEELDPAVGSVSVIDGEIVCEVEDQSGSGGVLISVIVVPKGWVPLEAETRVSAWEQFESDPQQPFIGGNEPSNDVIYGAVPGVVSAGEGTYGPSGDGNQYTLPFMEELVEVNFTDPMPSGWSPIVLRNYGGF